jgi:hypothetical protein
MAKNVILTVPQYVCAVRFNCVQQPKFDQISAEDRTLNDLDFEFLSNPQTQTDGFPWFATNRKDFMDNRHIVYSAYLEPTSGKFVHNLERFMDNYQLDQPITVHKLTRDAIRNRMGHNNVHIGKVANARTHSGSSLMSHTISKNDLLRAGDLAVQLKETGDGFHKYQLLHKSDSSADLFAVDGMDFSAYEFDRKPLRIYPVQYLLNPNKIAKW